MLLCKIPRPPYNFIDFEIKMQCQTEIFLYPNDLMEDLIAGILKHLLKITKPI